MFGQSSACPFPSLARAARQVEKTKRKKASSNAVSPVQVVQTESLAVLKKTLKLYSARASVVFKGPALAEKLKAQPEFSKGTADFLKKHDTVTQLLDEAKQLKDSVPMWTMDNAETEKQRLDALLSNLACADVALNDAFETLQGHKRSLAKSAARARADVGKRLAAAVRPWIAAGLQQNWAAALLATDLVSFPVDSNIVPEDSGAAVEDDEPEPTASKYEATMFEVQQDKKDWERPLWFSCDPDRADASVATMHRQVFDALTPERVKHFDARLDQWFKTPQKGGALRDTGMLRMKVATDDEAQHENDGYEAQKWVPTGLLSHGKALENVRSFGAPWLCVDDSHHVRADAADFPAYGFGHFVLVRTGCMAVFVWDMSLPVSMGVSCAKSNEWLGSGLPKDTFLKYLHSSKIVHVRLQAGDTAWIPDGWCSTWVNLLDEPVHTLYVPVLVSARASRVPANILNSMIQASEAWLKDANGTKPWDVMGPTMLAWMKALLPQHSQD